MRWIFWGFPYLFVFFRALFSLLSSALGTHPWHASNEEVKYCKWYAQPLGMKSCDRVSCWIWSFWLEHFWEKSGEADVSLTLILWLFWRCSPLLSLPLHFPALRWVRAQENKAWDVNVVWRPYVISILVYSVFVGRLCWISSGLKARNYTGLSGCSSVDSSAISTDSDGNKKKGFVDALKGSGLKKEPDHSLIWVNGSAEKFTIGYFTHLRIKEIWATSWNNCTGSHYTTPLIPCFNSGMIPGLIVKLSTSPCTTSLNPA